MMFSVYLCLLICIRCTLRVVCDVTVCSVHRFCLWNCVCFLVHKLILQYINIGLVVTWFAQLVMDNLCMNTVAMRCVITINVYKPFKFYFKCISSFNGCFVGCIVIICCMKATCEQNNDNIQRKYILVCSN